APHASSPTCPPRLPLLAAHDTSPLPLPAPVSFALNDPAPPEIPPLSLHDALPISRACAAGRRHVPHLCGAFHHPRRRRHGRARRSEEHTSELQSLTNLVCRLLLEKKKETSENSDYGPRDQTSRPYTVSSRSATSTD